MTPTDSFEPAAGSLVSDDAIYDGVIVDSGDGADREAYRDTMRRLRSLPVKDVFGGHNSPMSRERMLSVIDSYLASRAD